MREIPGGITAVKAVRASGVFCGIKRARPDLALVVSDRTATVAGVTTANRVKAAPVLLCERHLRFGRFSAAVANSGNAKDRKSTRLNSSHIQKSRMPSSA